MQFLVVLVLNSFLGTIAARRCLLQTVPTAGDPWSPEQANNEPTQQNPGHARIFGFPIEPVGSLTICTAYGIRHIGRFRCPPTPRPAEANCQSLAPRAVRSRSGFFFVRAAWLIIGLSAADLIWRYCQRHAPRAGSSGLARYNESYCRMDCTPDHRGIPLE